MPAAWGLWSLWSDIALCSFSRDAQSPAVEQTHRVVPAALYPCGLDIRRRPPDQIQTWGNSVLSLFKGCRYGAPISGAAQDGRSDNRYGEDYRGLGNGARGKA